MNIILEELLGQEENLWLEFKCCWTDNISEQKVWGEFLKDFTSLFNTYTDTNDVKYLIIGFDEITKKTQNYNFNHGTFLKVFDDPLIFKKKIIKKLKSHFLNIPSYMNSQNLPMIETLFDISIEEKDKNKLLVFTFYPAPYLLELKKILVGNETFREGNVITRKLKKNNSPEITNATSRELASLREYVSNHQNITFSENEITINKIVEAFKNKNFQSSEIRKVEVEFNYTSGIFFEIFSIEGEYTPTIDFIYFSKYTTQKKSVNYIVENKFLIKNNKKIILIDEENKDGGIIDKSRIKTLFQEDFRDVEVYYLEEFNSKKLYNDLFDSNIFHQGGFNIKDFIQPFTDKSKEKTADLLLNEWYYNNQEPLLVMKGMGGIGKTTVVKYFLDTLHKDKKDLNILFINSHEIIHEIMRNPKIEDIFDFYKIVAEKHEVQKRFDKQKLELSIDDGNMIIVLDGLDEVIAKVGSQFNINKFINSIFTEYSDNLRKAKILITCRDYFWDKSIEHDDEIVTIMLKPFTMDMAKEYFQKHLETKSKLDKAIELAEEFSIHEKNDKTYIPYILDMLKEELLMDLDSSTTIESDILLKQGNVNDFLIGKVCEREIYKLENISIDKQLNLFIEMAVKYEGSLSNNQLKKLEGDSQLNLEKFKSHPLLEYNNSSQELKFRYDFFNEYFKNIKLSIFLKNNDFDLLDKDIIEIMIQHISYDGSLIKDIKKRIETIDYEELTLSIHSFIQYELYNRKDINENIKNRLNSALFILLLVIHSPKNTEERTTLLKDIYEDNKIIKKLCIINLHTSQSKLIFNFENLILENCFFENYEYFTECILNEKTLFRNTTFIAPLHRKSITPQITFKNIDQSDRGRCNIEGIIDILEAQEVSKEQEDSDIRKNLKKIIKIFWSNSSFRQKTKAEVRRKLSKHNHLLDILIKNNIIDEVSVVTQQKRNDKAYLINNSYTNLRKIMEENSSCLEFEKILKIIKQNI